MERFGLRVSGCGCTVEGLRAGGFTMWQLCFDGLEWVSGGWTPQFSEIVCLLSLRLLLLLVLLWCSWAQAMQSGTAQTD